MQITRKSVCRQIQKSLPFLLLLAYLLDPGKCALDAHKQEQRDVKTYEELKMLCLESKLNLANETAEQHWTQK